MLEYLHSVFVFPFEYDFFLNALIGITFIAITAGLVSTFLILKGWSLYGDALSHAVLPGIILALIFGGPVTIGIFILALMVTFTIQFFKKHTVYHEQTVLSFVTSTYMGIGFMLYYAFPQGIRITEILFGKIVGLTFWNLVGLGTIALFTIILIVTSYKTLALVFFDRMFAAIIGLKIRVYEFLFYILLAIAVMSSILSVGALLIVSMLIIPGAFAFILSKRLKVIFCISITFSLITAWLGMFLSFKYNMSTGATVITLQFTTFLIVFFSQFFKRRLMIKNTIKNTQAPIETTSSLGSMSNFSTSINANQVTDNIKPEIERVDIATTARDLEASRTMTTVNSVAPPPTPVTTISSIKGE